MFNSIKIEEVQLQVDCETRMEGKLEVEEMYILYNYNHQYGGLQITPINQSFEIHHNKKALKLNLKIPMYVYYQI